MYHYTTYHLQKVSMKKSTIQTSFSFRWQKFRFLTDFIIKKKIIAKNHCYVSSIFVYKKFGYVLYLSVFWEPVFVRLYRLSASASLFNTCVFYLQSDGARPSDSLPTKKKYTVHISILYQNCTLRYIYVQWHYIVGLFQWYTFT